MCSLIAALENYICPFNYFSANAEMWSHMGVWKLQMGLYLIHRRRHSSLRFCQNQLDPIVT